MCRSATKPGVYGPTSRARDEITDDRGEPGAVRREAKDKSGAEAASQGEDQVEGVHSAIISGLGSSVVR